RSAPAPRDTQAPGSSIRCCVFPVKFPCPHCSLTLRAKRMNKRVGVFCGSSHGFDPIYADAARNLGTALVAREVGLVYGGGNIGMMGVLADAVLAAKGEVIGVIPRFLMDKELGHQGGTKLIVCESMHERKATMAEHANAFIALPGGYGTADEFFEIL